MILIFRLVLAEGFVLMETNMAPRPLVPFKIFRGEVGFVLASVSFGWASFGFWLATSGNCSSWSDPHATRSRSTFLPDLATGSRCNWLNQIPHALHSPSLYPDIFNGCIHPRSDPPDCRASDADILGLDIPLPAHHSIWHRYVLPSHDHHNVQRSPKGYVRHS
jgi:hypothetical protein